MEKKKFKIKKKAKNSRELMPHQVEAYSYLQKNYGLMKGGALFVEMRLGKTLTTVRFIVDNIKPGQRVLVVSPKTVCRTWVEELERENERMILNLASLNTKQQKLKALDSGINWKWIIVNFESVKTLEIDKYLTKHDYVVIDESIAIANPRTGITKHFLNQKIFPQWKKYVLCGNPAPESPMQYYSQLKFSVGNLLNERSYWAFRANRCKIYGYKWELTAEAENLLYDDLHRKAFIKTRKQAGIGSKKIYEKRYIEATTEQKKAYKAMLQDFEFESVETMYSPVQYLHLARIAGGMHPEVTDNFDDQEWLSLNKFKEVCSLLDGELKNEQTIVWFRFRRELEAMQIYLEEHLPHLKVCVVHGDVPVVATRKNNVTRDSLRLAFLRGEYDVALMTISTSKRGSDWSSASTEIYFSNEYSSDARSQSEDRVIHPQKKEPILIIDLITEGTVDEAVVEVLKDKKLDSSRFLSKLLLKLKAMLNG